MKSYTEYESLMSQAGVPKNYWYSKINDLKPFTFGYSAKEDNKKLSLPWKKQQAWIDELLKTDKFEANPRMVVASFPSDHNAMKIASKIISNRVKRNIRGKPLMINSADLEYMPALPKCDFCVIHNIFSKTIDYRLQKVRDLVTKVTDCPVILVVGGVNPVEFARTLNLNISRAAYYREVSSI